MNGEPERLKLRTLEPGVYAPQEDSRFLIETMHRTVPLAGRSVLDLCTGSGVVAVAAAHQDAADVTAFDICPKAVRSARRNAESAGVHVDVRVGTHRTALEGEPFDVVLANPPYLPTGPDAHHELISEEVGPASAWNAGPDGRLVLDPICDSAPDLLARGGTLLVVQSELADPARSLRRLSRGGLRAAIAAIRNVPFGPVLTARAPWLESIGKLRSGNRSEQLVVIRADKP